VIALDELKIPRGLRPVVDEIVSITDSVCLSVLDEEYADLARRAVAKLARKRPSPLQAGRRATWAAGVVYALGHVNFLADPASEPCVTADQLSAAFGVAKSTMTSKARQVRDLLRISHFSPEFQRADVVAQNPLAWIIEVNGLAVDARHAPPGIQAEAYRRGLIPYIPAPGPDETADRARSQETGTPPVASATEMFPHAGGRLASPRRDAVADAAAASEVADMLEHCSDLKRRLVEFARSRRFSRQFDQALSAGSRGKAVDESEFINIIDHFILQRPLPGGRTVVETFVSAHPKLAEADRQMLLGWRDVVGTPAGCSRKPTRRRAASTLASRPGDPRSACRASLPARRPSHWPMTKRKGLCSWVTSPWCAKRSRIPGLQPTLSTGRRCSGT